jgi:hypothetical protein
MPRVYTKRRVENTTETVDPSPLTNLGAPYRVTIATSGGGGDGNVEYVAGGTDPNGSKTSTRPAICYDDIGNLWVKTNAGTNNTGWEKIVSAESVSEPAQAQEVEVPLLVKLLPKILPTIRKVEPVGVPLIRTESPQMPPIGLGETRSSRWKKFAGSLKSLMASFFALWMVLLLIPMAAEGSLPPAIQHNPFTTNVPPANLTGDVTTSASLATTLTAGSASVLNSGTLGAARMPALTGAITTSAGAVATSLGSFSSASLSGALTDETGSGAAVFATSPTFTTPTLGVATATSLTLTGTDPASFSVELDLLGPTNYAAGNVRLAGGLYCPTNMTASFNFNKLMSWTNIGAAFTIPAPIGVDGTKTMGEQTLYSITNNTAAAVLVTGPANAHMYWWGTNVTGFYLTNFAQVWAFTYGGAITNLYVSPGF